MLIDMKSVLKDAQEEVRKEHVARAKEVLKKKLKALADAEQIVANLKRELDDLQVSITEGTF
jgi:hypothetical protein